MGKIPHHGQEIIGVKRIRDKQGDDTSFSLLPKGKDFNIAFIMKDFIYSY